MLYSSVKCLFTYILELKGFIMSIEKEKCGLNGKLGQLITEGKSLDSKECKEVLSELSKVNERETYFKNLFGDDISIFDTFISIENVTFDYLLDLCDKDIFLPLFKHSSAGFIADASQIGRVYTDRNIGEAISNFKISFDDYFGLRVETQINYKNQFFGIWFKMENSKNLFYISGEHVDFRGGYRIDNCKLHTKDLIFSNDFKHIKWGRGCDTALNSFCKYSTNETLKEWLTINKEILKG